MPVYNTEKYLEKCLGSLVGQTFKDIEIVCVNDGSKDRSLDIVKDFATRDTRVKVIDQVNKGVAEARNVGLQNASGKYIMWCDSDDEYTPNMCEQMLTTLITHNVDIVACGMQVINDVDKRLVKDIEEYVRLKFQGKHTIDWNLIVWTDVSLPTKIMKKSLIDKYSMHFPTGLHFEDAYFLDQYFTAAKTIYYLNKKLYKYNRNNDSIMSRSFKKTSVSLDYIQIIPKTYQYLKQNNLFDEYRDFFWHRFIQYYTFSYDNAPRSKRWQVYRWGKKFIYEHRDDTIGVAPHIVADVTRLVSPVRQIKTLGKKTIKRVLPKKLHGPAKALKNKIR